MEYWFRDLSQDLRYSIRSLRRSPAFSVTAILTVALGIGVNAAVFNLIYTVLLDPLPYRDPGRLVHLAETHPDFSSYQVAAPEFFDWQRTAASFEGMAAYTFREANDGTIQKDGATEAVQLVQASAGLFPLLGVKPLLGRFYSAQEERQRSEVVLLSESLWRQKYGSDPSIVGRKIQLGSPLTVVGIVPQGQAEPSWAQVWMPLSFLDPALTKTRRFHVLEVVARLKPGIRAGQAQTEMKEIADRLSRAYPATNGKTGVNVLPLSLWATGEVRPALLIAWAAVSLVLLLACANVAHLVLIRTVHRSREIAMRAALGAGLGRICRFLLTENLLLALTGGLLGLVLARVLLPLLSRWAPVDISGLNSSLLSPAALLFSGFATFFCMSLFALPALLHSRKMDIQQVIKQSSGLSLTHRRSYFGPSILAVEIALALTVMTGAGLLYRSFAGLLDEKTGFDSRNVLAVDIPLALDLRRSVSTFEQKIARRLRQIPGVTSVAAANCGPMMLHSTDMSRYTRPFSVVGQSLDASNVPLAQVRWTTPGYFQTLRIPLKRGRLFTDSEVDRPGYLINETLARRFFPNQDPIGQRLWKDMGGPSPTAVPIVGVVGDVRDLGLDREPVPTLYELGVSNWVTLLIRGDGSARSLIPSVRNAIRAVSPEDAITTIAPLDQIVQSSLDRRRFGLELLGVFAALGAILTAIGVYGVISYSLSQRTGEFAIRFALGAERRDVWRLILTKFVPPAMIGVFAGAWLAYLFAYALRTQLYKLPPTDPLVFCASAAALLTIVIVSAIRPAAKAASVSPAAVLRG